VKIELPDSLKDWLEREAEAGGYASPGAFVERLLLREQSRRERIDQKLLEALDSGAPIEVMPEFWDDQRRQLEASLLEPA
jgi:Arc/MetJ-type ribon-helix-helix transcriptional regulator